MTILSKKTTMKKGKSKNQELNQRKKGKEAVYRKNRNIDK